MAVVLNRHMKRLLLCGALLPAVAAWPQDRVVQVFHEPLQVHVDHKETETGTEKDR